MKHAVSSQVRRWFRQSVVLVAAGMLAGATTEAAPEPLDLGWTRRPLAVPGGSAWLEFGPRTPVNPSFAGQHRQIELAADPECADNLMIGGARTNPRRAAGFESFVYQSSDRGRTWRETMVQDDTQWVSEGSIAYGLSHRAYFVASSSLTGTGNSATDHHRGTTRLYRSRDGGRRWELVHSRPFMDWTRLFVNNTARAERGTVHVLANVMADGLGKWLPERPPLLSLQGEPLLPQFVAALPQVPGKSSFPQGATVLSDGRIVAVANAPIYAPGNQSITGGAVEALRSSDGGRSFAEPVAVWPEPRWTSALAVHPRSEQLYLAFSVSDDPNWNPEKQHRLMLARSADGGATWQTHRVAAPPGETIDIGFKAPSLAVNDHGVLAFLWYGHGQQRVYCGVSLDNGHTLARVDELTPAIEPHRPTWPMVERSLNAIISPPRGETGDFRLRVDGDGPGWGLGWRNPPFGNSVVADAKGGFHAAWAEVANGSITIYSRTFGVVPHSDSGDEPNLDPLADVTKRFRVEADNCRLDSLGGTVAIDVAVVNVGEEAVSAPLFIGVSANGETDHNVINSDNRLGGPGALWEVHVPTGRLASGEKSDPRTLIFRVKLPQEHPVGKGIGTLFDTPLRIYTPVSR